MDSRDSVRDILWQNYIKRTSAILATDAQPVTVFKTRGIGFMHEFERVEVGGGSGEK